MDFLESTPAYIWMIPVILLFIWEAVWKGIALWRAARNSHLAWYVCILIFNTAGILPIVYIVWFSKNKSPAGSP
jgi:hypothetical protein